MILLKKIPIISIVLCLFFIQTTRAQRTGPSANPGRPGLISAEKTRLIAGRDQLFIHSLDSAFIYIPGRLDIIKCYWQVSTDNVNWRTITESIGIQEWRAYADTIGTFFYRRGISDTFTAVISINVEGLLNGGTISGAQRIVVGNTPSMLVNKTGPSGGSGSYTYQWQSSGDGINWTNIGAATGLTYQPVALSGTMYYRRKTATDLQVGYSNTVQVLVASTAAVLPSGTTVSGTNPVATLPQLSSTLSTNLRKNVDVTILRPDLTSWTSPPFGFSEKDFGEKISYLDGLLRPLQVILYKNTPSGKDVVETHIYDALGDVPNNFMAYSAPTDTSNQGRLRTDINVQQPAYYNTLSQGQDNYYYSSQAKEKSPIPRSGSDFSEGSALVGLNKGQKIQVRTNTSLDQVRVWQIGDNDMDVPYSNGLYADGTLTVSIATNEDNSRVYTYTDNDNRKILETIQRSGADNTSDRISTYYIYDGIGNIRYVLTPLAIKYCEANNIYNFSSITGILQNLSYKCLYDTKGRMYSMEQPGSNGAVYIVYDDRNRPVLVQNPILRARGLGEWLMCSYDATDRITMTAVYKDVAATRTSLQTLFDDKTVVVTTSQVTIPAVSDLYVNNRDVSQTQYVAKKSVTLSTGFASAAGDEFTISIDSNLVGSVETVSSTTPSTVNLTNYEPLTILHYDDYDWQNAPAFSTDYLLDAGSNKYPVNVAPYYAIQGAVTGTRKKVLGTDQWLTTVLYYDKYGNMIQKQEDNVVGGKNITTLQYDYTGNVICEHRIIRNPRANINGEIRTQVKYAYDNNQLISITHTILSGNQVAKQIAGFEYDDNGLVTKTNLGGLETLDYTYDFKGRVTGINAGYVDDKSKGNYFGLKFSYETGFTGNKNNGQLSGVTWRRTGDQDAAHAYGYSYNSDGSLTTADYTQNTGGNWNNSQEDYKVSGVDYDANGNIMHMKQNGTLPGKVVAGIDDLTYSYANNGYSNQLSAVADAVGNQQQGDFADGAHTTAEYTYDVKGNLTHDYNRGIALQYDPIINKVVKISIDADATKYISYVYDAQGKKLQRIVNDGTKKTTYTYMDGYVYKNDSLQYFMHPTGRVRVNSAGAMVYDYFISDQLGNTRTVITDETNVVYYKATHETNPQPAPAVPETETFTFPKYIDDIPVSNPFYDYNGTTNRKFVKLNATDPDRKVGTSKALRVMAGDSLQLGVQSYFASTSSTNNTPSDLPDQIVNQLISSLLGSVTVVPNGHSNIVEGVSNGYVLNKDDLNSFVTDRSTNNLPSNIPKAYLNVIVFDDNFKLVEAHAYRVSSVGVVAPLTSQLNIKKNGYVYAFVENDDKTDVFFDDLTIKHTTGHLLQEDSYYPFGLQIRALSSRALNRLQHNYLYNGIEQVADFDLGLYDAQYRTLDPQLGKWLQIDPAASDYAALSAYNSNFNDPIDFDDPFGDDPLDGGPGDPIGYSFHTVSTQQNTFYFEAIFKRSPPAFNVFLNYGGENVTNTILNNIGGGIAKRTLANVMANDAANQALRNQTFGDIAAIATIKPKDDIPKNVGTIKEFEPSVDYEWSESTNFIAEATYKPADALYVTLQALNPFIDRDEIRHINNVGINGNERVEAFVNLTSEVVSNEVGGQATKAMAGLVLPTFRPLLSKFAFQSHHIIPNAVYEKFETELLSMGWFQDHALNLKKLPTFFHGNHPKYNVYVTRKIEELIENGTFDFPAMESLQSHMRQMINKAYLSSPGVRLNDYFRSLVP